MLRSLSEEDNKALERAGSTLHLEQSSKIFIAALHEYVRIERQNAYLNMRVQELENAVGYLRMAKEYEKKALMIIEKEGG